MHGHLLGVNLIVCGPTTSGSMHPQRFLPNTRSLSSRDCSSWGSSSPPTNLTVPMKLVPFSSKSEELVLNALFAQPGEGNFRSAYKKFIISVHPQYISIVKLIQGWVQQTSLEEFKNFLISQELFVKQMIEIKRRRRSMHTRSSSEREWHRENLVGL